MRIVLSFVVMGFAFVISGFGQGGRCPETSPNGAWHKYQTEVYVIEFPCPNAKLDKGQLSGATAVTAANQITNFGIIEKIFDRSVEGEEAASLLEKGAQAQLNDPRSKIIEKRDVEYRGIKGKELVLQKSGNIVIGRVFVHRDRLFILSVNEAGDSKVEDAKRRAQRFFESFVIR